MRALAVITLLGCGRVGFDPRSDATDIGVDTPAAVCGDQVCSGGAGELCSACSDCATLAQVCGNGACDPGESPGCYADCGPTPWTWTSDANALLAAVNQARTNGTMCPGGGGMQIRPALVYDTSLEPFAREVAWETAHESWTNNVGCNGRSFSDQLTMLGAAALWKVYGAATPGDAIGFLLGMMGSCNSIMAAGITQLGGAGAYDALNAHTIVLR